MLGERKQQKKKKKKIYTHACAAKNS